MEIKNNFELKDEKKQRYQRFDKYKEQGLTISEIIEAELKLEKGEEEHENENN